MPSFNDFFLQVPRGFITVRLSYRHNMSSLTGSGSQSETNSIFTVAVIVIIIITILFPSLSCLTTSFCYTLAVVGCKIFGTGTKLYNTTLSSTMESDPADALSRW